ncbi:unnamed protein product [Meganyctiphanes norvegica]|uniref:Uncharacterized protein n=1 Tax=Meganyctiphanes norvegica TaxID=48144 RepID=A0AAV2QD58_MEGNR
MAAPAICDLLYLPAIVTLVIVSAHAQGNVQFPGSSSDSSSESCVLPSGETGICKLINDCPEALENLFTQRPKICSFQGRTPIVCCAAASAPLPVHGNWSPWSAWSSCSAECQRQRSRTCSDPVPKNGGRNCPGERTSSENCTTGECAKTIDISPPTTNFECGKATQVTHGLFRRKRAFSQGNTVLEVSPFTDIFALAGPAVRESTRNAWPWMALLGQDRAGRRSWFCSGVLLNQQWVLTAAHCTNRLNVTWVRLGEHDFSNADDGVGVRVEDFSVAEVIYHPGYKPPQAYHDISLIRLAKPVQLRREARPICLPWGHEADLPLEDKTVTITGWGARFFGGPFSPVLNEVNVTVFENKICANSYSTLLDYKFNYPQSLGEESICAGDNLDQGNDSCEGDSGGPAVLLRGSHYTLVGIVSKGFGCGKKDFPGIYVRAQYPEHLAWIKKVAFSNT